MEPSAATPVASSEQEPGLHWGIKRRFLQYIARMPDGQCSVTDGAAVDENDRFHFALRDVNLAGGSTGNVTCRGDVRFAGHHGMLFVSIADPVLHIEGDHGQLSISAAGPDTDPGHDSTGRRVLAEFDLKIDLDAAPEVDSDRGTVRTSAGRSVRLSSEAVDIFNGVYPPGELLDDFTLVLPHPNNPQAQETR